MNEQLRRAAFLCAAASLPLAGCGEARPVEGQRACTTVWKMDVETLLVEKCGTCHSGAAPQGGYDITTYTSTLEDASGGIIAVAGKLEGSLLLTKIEPTTATDPHKGFDSVFAKLETWVVECDLQYSTSRVHLPGIMNPASPDFHGTLLAQMPTPFDTGDGNPRCQECHGQDLMGGTSGVSCSSCHKGTFVDPLGKAVTDSQTCLWCHDQPPAKGAHLAHFKGSNLSRAFDCTECHVKPADYRDPGHLLDAGGKLLTDPADPAGRPKHEATLTFGAFAALSYGSVTRGGPPSYAVDVRRCSNVYCHGGAFATDASATNIAPSWNGGPAEAACGTCHGLPPATPSHATGLACAFCHSKVVDAQKNVIDVTRHLDGKVSLGDETGTCTACHGSGMYGAPPKDLLGNDSTSAVGVGAHQAHLNAAHQLRGPMVCGDCHLLPLKVDSPGHLDHAGPALVFPIQLPGFASIATSDGALPVWDHNAATCTNVYCHGGGNLNGTDMSPGLHRVPLWTGTSAEARCGTCHGVPPTGAPHNANMGLQTCAGCHDQTIDAQGNLILTGLPGHETSTHINGMVEHK